MDLYDCDAPLNGVQAATLAAHSSEKPDREVPTAYDHREANGGGDPPPPPCTAPAWSSDQSREQRQEGKNDCTRRIDDRRTTRVMPRYQGPQQ